MRCRARGPRPGLILSRINMSFQFGARLESHGRGRLSCDRSKMSVATAPTAPWPPTRPQQRWNAKLGRSPSLSFFLSLSFPLSRFLSRSLCFCISHMRKHTYTRMHTHAHEHAHDHAHARIRALTTTQRSSTPAFVRARRFASIAFSRTGPLLRVNGVLERPGQLTDVHQPP